MLKHLSYFGRFLFFWLVFFAFYRLVFFCFYLKHFVKSSLSDNIQSFFQGLRLDISTICYFLSFSFICWLIYQIKNKSFLNRLNLIFHSLLIIIVSLIFATNLKLYNEWGTIFNYRALSYAIYPKEVLASVTLFSLLQSLLIWLGFTVSGIWLFKKVVTAISYTNVKEWNLSLIIFAFLFVIGIRGGLQLIPINESSAYFSKTTYNNHLAVNHVWYLINNILENTNSNNNPYQFFEANKSDQIVGTLYKNNQDSSIAILNSNKPNIILVVLESYSADFIGKLGGIPGISPVLDSLCAEGLLFTNIYSTGFRTEQGLVSLLSGFPSVPTHSVIRTPEKVEKLPLLNKTFVRNGYNSSFYYGGETSFGNINLYLRNSGFEKIIEKKDFSHEQLNSKWGAHDEYVFSRNLNEEKKSPFFDVILTLSNHEPFEVPMKDKFNGNSELEKFKNAAYYTDKCIGDYFKVASTKNWFKNTLFIFVADHGHYMPKQRDAHDPLSRKIPLIFFGPVLKSQFKGTVINKIGNHNDLPITLLKQLNIVTNDFKWSKDLLNTTSKDFAFLANESGFSWLTPDQDLVYFTATKEVSTSFSKKNQVINDSTLLNAKSYMQKLYTEFLGM